MKARFYAIITIFILMIIALILCFYVLNKYTIYRNLNNLNFNITILQNGDVKVVETWDIDFNQTNTLYKNFKLDSSKFQGISDVSVIELNNYNKYKKIDNYQYHLPKNTYYALNINDKFEIGWGTEWSEKNINRTYQISYTLKSAVINYNDCSEWYWQLLGNTFSIPANNIEGIIKLPNGITNIEDIKVWGHNKSLNGNIKIVDLNTIEFNSKHYQGNQYLEIRLMLPPNIVKSGINTKGYNKENILNQEKEFSNESNSMVLTFYLIYLIIGLATCIEILQIIKYIKMLKKEKERKLKPIIDYQYFREIPDENTTPGEAIFLINSLNEPTHGENTDIFISTILSLAMKEYIEIKNTFKEGKEISYIEFTKKGELYKTKIYYGADENNEIKADEKEILKFLYKLSNGEKTLAIKNISNYIEKNEENTKEFVALMRTVKDKIEVEQNLKGNINFESNKQIKKYNEKMEINFLIIIALIYLNNKLYNIVLLILSLFGTLFCLINICILYIIKKNVSYLTQKGTDERDKWEALYQYINEYSLLKDKDEISLGIWEKYLIFATAFGISTKVLKQMPINLYMFNDTERKIDYNNFDYLKKNINDALTRFINTRPNNFSSGSGLGGGFSSSGIRGGGAGRSRWWRKII